MAPMASTVHLLAVLSLALITSSYAALYERAASLPTTKFDFIIVGGGTAGNVLANRLSEDPRVDVLVLEAGLNNQNQRDSIVPFIGPSTLTNPNPINWNFTTIAEPGLNNRILEYPRGFVLGGSSSINGMVYTRGSKDDYNRYAQLTGDPGWSWLALQGYIRKNERWLPPTDHHNISGQFDPLAHGYHGVNSVSLPGFSFSINNRIIKTTQQLPEDFPFNLDYNDGTPLGIGWAPATIKDGVRSSSATSYLAPQYINRKNLHVLIHARVTRLIQTSKGKQSLAFQQVEFAQDGPSNPRITIRATKEVILSAGAVMSPHILQQSGIGDKEELLAAGIQPILDLPSVGKNASDHPITVRIWAVNSTQTLDTLAQNQTLYNELYAQWNRSHTGLFGTNGVGHLGWKRLDKNSSTLKQYGDPSAGPNTPHIELSFSDSGLGTNGFGMAIGVFVVTPASRGWIKPASKDPFQQPLIKLGALTHPFDIAALKEGLAFAKQFVSAPVWKDYILQEVIPNTEDDTALEQYIRNSSITAYHIVGTAAMSARNASYGVVDPDLKVKGVQGLRVVDASVFPYVPTAHTQAATYIFAERAADLIKFDWLLS